MEEVLVNINYLIREKLWGSVKALADKVSHPAPLMRSIQSIKFLTFNIGTRKRLRCWSHILESVWHF